MIKILFAYEYLGLGGVEAILATRMRALKLENYDIRAMFSQNAGGMALFTGLIEQVHLTTSPLQKMDLIVDYQPDVLVSLDTPGIVGAARSLLPEIKIIYEIHTTYPQALKPLKNRNFTQQINGFIVPSSFQARFIQNFLHNTDIPITIVPDPLDDRFTKPLSDSNQQSKPIIAWVGRLDQIKNWRAFVKIASLISRQNSDVVFYLIGGLYSPMEEQNSLWNSMIKHKLVERMRWFPSVAPDQMPAVFDEVRNSGGCVISTSIIESFGMSILEAMSRACPVVVPDGGSLAELAGEQTRGLTYPLTNLNEAVQKVLLLLENPSLRHEMGKCAHEFALNYTWQVSNEAFLKAIQSIKS